MMNSSEKWLKLQNDIRIEQEAQAKPAFFNTFDEYVKCFPEGENWRHMVAKDELLIATYEDQSCLEGDYYIVWIRRHFDRTTGQYTKPTHIVVNNGDDLYYEKAVTTEQEVIQEIESLKMMAPFWGHDLPLFGYNA